MKFDQSEGRKEPSGDGNSQDFQDQNKMVDNPTYLHQQAEPFRLSPIASQASASRRQDESSRSKTVLLNNNAQSGAPSTTINSPSQTNTQHLFTQSTLYPQPPPLQVGNKDFMQVYSPATQKDIKFEPLKIKQNTQASVFPQIQSQISYQRQLIQELQSYIMTPPNLKAQQYNTLSSPFQKDSSRFVNRILNSDEQFKFAATKSGGAATAQGDETRQEVRFAEARTRHSSNIYRDTRRGFKIQNKKIQTLIKFDQPLKVVGQKDLNDERQFINKTELAKIQNSLDQDNPMVQNIFNSKHHTIQKRQREKQNKIKMPKEFLSRHPAELKKYRLECRIGRGESKNALPSMNEYLEMTPSSDSQTLDGLKALGHLGTGHNSLQSKTTFMHSKFDNRTSKEQINDQSGPQLFESVRSLQKENSHAVHISTGMQYQDLNTDSEANKLSRQETSKANVNLQSDGRLTFQGSQMADSAQQPDYSPGVNPFKITTSGHQAILINQQHNTPALRIGYQKTDSSMLQSLKSAESQPLSPVGNDTSTSYIFNPEHRIHLHGAESAGMQTTKNISQNSSMFPIVMDNQKVSSHIFEYKDVKKVLNKQISMLTKSQSPKIPHSVAIRTETAPETRDSQFSQIDNKGLTTSGFDKKSRSNQKKQNVKTIITRTMVDNDSHLDRQLHKGQAMQNATHQKEFFKFGQRVDSAQMSEELFLQMTPEKVFKFDKQEKIKGLKPYHFKTLSINAAIGALNPTAQDDAPAPRGLNIPEILKLEDQNRQEHFLSIKQKQTQMVQQYNETLQQSEWKSLPYKIEKAEVEKQNKQQQETEPVLRPNDCKAKLGAISFRIQEQQEKSFEKGDNSSPSQSKISKRSPKVQTSQMSFAAPFREDGVAKTATKRPTNMSLKSKVKSKLHQDKSRLSQYSNQKSQTGQKFGPNDQSVSATVCSPIREYESEDQEEYSQDDFESEIDWDLPIDQIVEEYGINYHQIFEKKVKRNQEQCLIQQQATQLIDQMDGQIAEKKNAAEILKTMQTKRKATKAFDEKRGSHFTSNTNTTHTSNNTGRSKEQQQEEQSPSKTVKRIPTKKLHELPPIVQEVLKEENNKEQEANQQQQQTKQASQNASAVTPRCDLKELMKQFIRYIRNIDNDYAKTKEALRNLSPAAVDVARELAAHDFEEEVKMQKQLKMMQLYDDFLDKFENSDYKVKVRKPQMFKSFIKKVQQDESYLTYDFDHFRKQDLKLFINQQNLTKGTVDYKDFYEFCNYMALKQKKKDKLQKNTWPEKVKNERGEWYHDPKVLKDSKIVLDWSEDSSDNEIGLYGDENFSPIKKEIDLQIKNPSKCIKQCDGVEIVEKGDLESGSDLHTESEGEPDADNQSLDVTINKKIMINNKMYMNFIRPLLQIDKLKKRSKRGNVDYQKIVSKLNADAKKAGGEGQPTTVDGIKFLDTEQGLKQNEDTTERYQLSIRDALKVFYGDLDALRRALDEKIKREEKQRYVMSKRENKVKNTNKHVQLLQDQMQQGLEDAKNKLQKDLRAREQQRAKLLKERQTGAEVSPHLDDRKYTCSLNLGSPVRSTMRPADPASRLAKTLASPSKIADLANSQQLLQTTKIEQNKQVCLYDDQMLKIKFYQNAKKLGQNSAEDYTNRDQLLMTYYQDCVNTNNELVGGYQSPQQAVTLPEPKFMKVLRNNMMIIKDEGLEIGHCLSLSQFIQQVQKNKDLKFEIRSLLIDDSQMDDKKIAIILDALYEEQALKQISLMNCSMATESNNSLLRLLEKQEPVFVEELRLKNITGLTGGQEDLLVEIVHKLASLSQIRILQISGQNLSNGRYVGGEQHERTQLPGLLRIHTTLKEIDISDSTFSCVPDFQGIVEALQENKNIQSICLRGINLSRLISSERHPKHQKGAAQIYATLAEIISDSQNLQHIDLSNMMLQDRAFPLVKALNRSQSILSMHIGGNSMTQNTIEKICIELSIDYRSLMLKLRENQSITDFCVSHQDELKCQLCNTQQTEAPTSQAVAPIRDDPTDLAKVVTKEIKRKLDTQIRDKAGLGDWAGPATRNQNALVISRFFQHHELIFKDSSQASDMTPLKHFDLTNVQERWKIKLKNQECYLCQKYTYCQIFYRRSQVEDQFQEVEDEKEIAYLKGKYDLDALQAPSDPFHKLPLLFGSILDSDVSSSRMMLAWHQAALVWAHKATKKKKTYQEGAKLLSRYIKAVQTLMRDHPAQVEREDKDELYKHFSTWRDQILPLKNDPAQFDNENFIVNFPIFDKHNPEEDDLYVFSGYIKPGSHNIIIYDPESDKFLKKENIFVLLRQGDLKFPKQDDNRLAPEEEDIEQLKFKGINFKNVQSSLYGNMLHDYKKRVAELAAAQDTDPNFFDMSAIAETDQREGERARLLEAIPSNYVAVLQVWKLFQIEYFCEECLQINIQTPDFAHFVHKIFKDCDFAKEITEQDYRDIFQSVTGFDENEREREWQERMAKAREERMRFREHSESEENEGEEEEVEPPTMDKCEKSLVFQRKQFLLCLIAIAQLIIEKEDVFEPLDEVFQTHIVEPLEDYLAANSRHNDLKQLRRKHIFQNKFLSALYIHNLPQVKAFYGKFTQVGVDATPQFTFGKSLRSFQEQLPGYKEAASGASAREIEECAKLHADQHRALVKLASQSQLSILNENLHGLKAQSILSREEFLIFIVLCSVYCEQSGAMSAPSRAFLCSEGSPDEADTLEVPQDGVATRRGGKGCINILGGLPPRTTSLEIAELVLEFLNSVAAQMKKNAQGDSAGQDPVFEAPDYAALFGRYHGDRGDSSQQSRPGSPGTHQESAMAAVSKRSSMGVGEGSKHDINSKKKGAAAELSSDNDGYES